MSSGHCPRPGYLLCLNNVLWNYPWSFQFPNLVVQFTIPFILIFPRVAFPPSPGSGAGPSNAGEDPGQSRLPGHPSSFPGPVSSGPSSSILSSRTKDVLTRFSAVPSYRLIPQLSVIFTTMSLASKVLYFTQSSLPIELPLRRSRLKLLYLIGPSILQDSQTSPFIQKYLQTEVFLRQANLNIFLSVHQKVKTACRLTSGWGYLIGSESQKIECLGPLILFPIYICIHPNLIGPDSPKKLNVWPLGHLARLPHLSRTLGDQSSIHKQRPLNMYFVWESNRICVAFLGGWS